MLDLSGLPAAERAQHYRELADKHLRLGRRMTSADATAAHLELAGLWMRLATEAERQAHAESPDLFDPTTSPAPAPETDFSA